MNIQTKTVRTLQNENSEIKSWHGQLFLNLGWSWHDYWRWQGYDVQVTIQNPMITNRITINEGAFEDMGFKRKTVWRFRTIKWTETIVSTFQNIPVEHKDPKRINWTWPSKRIRIKLNKTWRKGKSDQNRRNFAKLELRSQGLTCSTFT